MSGRLIVEGDRGEVSPRVSGPRVPIGNIPDILMRVIAGVHERYSARRGDQRIIDLRFTFAIRCCSGSLTYAIVQK